MTARHLEMLVEEPSMEAFLRALLPRFLPEGRSFEVHPFQGKHDLLGKLQNRLRGYAKWLPSDWRIVVIVDRDVDDCIALKQRLDGIAADAGLVVRGGINRKPWQLVNRIAIEELEAWYFGDWQAVLGAYPRVSARSRSSSHFESRTGSPAARGKLSSASCKATGTSAQDCARWRQPGKSVHASSPTATALPALASSIEP